MRAIKMNQQDKQLTDFLGKTIGSALDNYMANLADKQQKSERKIAAVEDKSRLVQQEKSKLEQQVKEREKKINDVGGQLRQKDTVAAQLAKELNDSKAQLYQKDIAIAQIAKELKETKAKLASMVAKQTQVDTPKPSPLPEQPVTQYFTGWQKVGFRVGAVNTELQWAAVLDIYKKLMWAVNDFKPFSVPHPAKLLTWQQAQEWVKQVNAKGWCGYHNWRLPTCDELSLILSLKAKNDFIQNSDTSTNQAFAVENTYWTSTTKAIAGIQQPHVYVVNFKLEFSYTATPNNAYQTRLVRSV